MVPCFQLSSWHPLTGIRLDRTCDKVPVLDRLMDFNKFGKSEWLRFWCGRHSHLSHKLESFTPTFKSRATRLWIVVAWMVRSTHILAARVRIPGHNTTNIVVTRALVVAKQEIKIKSWEIAGSNPARCWAFSFLFHSLRN